MEKKITEILTPEQAVAKFPDYVREIYESKDYNHAHQPLVLAYRYFNPDSETWDIDHWLLVFTSGYGTGVYVTDIWRHAKATPNITSFYLPNAIWEKMREVA
ncbi:hypothetical protein [Selenomonas sp. AE3005]|uniref:hypothetical protein n=1 Tax=Selenomonas sp. AE3005 TaxID=1485543 RepID=UPI0025D3BC17|nr:hypothetical protein [Selenomonas sp. AE3005]